MAVILTGCPRQVPNLYCQPGQPIGALVSNFWPIKFLPLLNTVPDLDQALSGARLDCGRDLHRADRVWWSCQSIDDCPGGVWADQSTGEWTTFWTIFERRTDSHVQARRNNLRIRKPLYRLPSNPNRSDKRVQRKIHPRQIRSPTLQSFVIHLENCKIRPSWGTQLAASPRVLNEEESHTQHPKRWWALLLYFLERNRHPKRHCERVTYYQEKMFQRNHLDTLPYPISPNDVHLYEDQLQMNINVFSFFDDEGRARHALVVSRKNNERVANLFYWKNHFAPIANISRLFNDLTKGKREHQICLRCFGHFQTEELLSRHIELCTRDDFMSVLHVLPVPGWNQAQIKFNQYKYCTKASFVIYADFESILELSGLKLKHTTYTQQHKMCAAAAILSSSFYYFDQRTVIKVGKNALAEFLDSLIVW